MVSLFRYFIITRHKEMFFVRPTDHRNRQHANINTPTQDGWPGNDGNEEESVKVRGACERSDIVEDIREVEPAACRIDFQIDHYSAPSMVANLDAECAANSFFFLNNDPSGAVSHGGELVDESYNPCGHWIVKRQEKLVLYQ